MIKINCTGSDLINIDDLTEFQGELKERSADDVDKIIRSIKNTVFHSRFLFGAKVRKTMY